MLRPTGSGPLFIYHNQQALTQQTITKELRILLLLCVELEPQSYASCFFWIGAATSDAIVPDHLVRYMGRWPSGTVLCYSQTHPAEVLPGAPFIDCPQIHCLWLVLYILGIPGLGTLLSIAG